MHTANEVPAAHSRHGEVGQHEIEGFAGFQPPDRFVTVARLHDLVPEHAQHLGQGLANRRLKAINRRLVEELRQKNEILQQHEHQLRERVAQATAQLKRLYDVGMEVSANLELAPVIVP